MLPIPRSPGRSRVRRLLAAVALSVGVIAGPVAVPGTANAIPPGGWCYDNWYEFGTNNGTVQHPYSAGGLPAIRQNTNNSDAPVTWTESITVNTTFTSTYTTTTTFSGGLDFGIISFGIQQATSVTTTISTTVSTTSSNSTTVNPGQTKYMAWGPFGLSTTGTYYQYKYGCDYGDFPSTTSGTVTGWSITSVGWRTWQ